MKSHKSHKLTDGLTTIVQFAVTLILTSLLYRILVNEVPPALCTAQLAFL